jgi:tetratricopeptide (TPR) repeat protein
MLHMRKMACFTLALASLASPAWAADDLMSSQLVDEARQWQQKDRDDIAAGLWRKLLRANPKHPEALIKLGAIETRAGNIKEAEALLNRASQLAAAPAGLNELSAALAAIKGPPKNLPAPPMPDAAKALEEMAITIRDKRVVPKLPRSEASQGLDQTSQATKKQWVASRRALEKRAQNNPDDSRHLVALARHLTYREGTRREALRQLEALTNRGLGTKETQKSWKNALLSLRAQPADRALFSTYLARFPDDLIILERLRSLEGKASVIAKDKEDEPRPISRPDLKKTEANLVTKPDANQAKVTATLKLVLANEQTSSVDHEAAKQARTLLEEAMLLDPGNSSVRLALARQYQRLGMQDEAGNLLDNLLEIHPDVVEGLHARAMLYAEQQKWGAGLDALERIPAEMRTASQTTAQRRMWIHVQVQRARQFFGQGNRPQAVMLMTQAQAAAEQDDSLFATVVGGWSDIGQPAKSLRLMQDVVSRSPMKMVSTRIKYAELLLSTGQDAELSAVLKDLSAPGRLSTEQQEEVNRIILGYTLRLTETLRESGRVNEAAAMLNPALQRFDDNRLLATMARVYKSASNPAAALELMERAIVREPDDVGYRLMASELALAVKEWSKADGHAKAALELAPNHPRVLAVAGRVEKTRGNVAKAITYFQRAQAQESNKEAFPRGFGLLSLRLIGQESSASWLSNKPSTSDPTGLLPIPEFVLPSDRQPDLGGLR